MTPKKFVAAAVAALCCAAAARASLLETKPMNLTVIRAALLMGADFTDISEPKPEPVQQSTGEEEPQIALERTITAAPIDGEGIAVSNLAEAEFSVPELLSLPDDRGGGRVLILHTHGCEAYTPTKKYSYEPTSDFRTVNSAYNVVRIGDEIEKVLTGCGIGVIHDRTLCDYPSYNESYNNSLAIAQGYVSENPDIKIILDVHRDSIAGDGGEQIKTVGAENTAQLMFVVGTDKINEHPLWRQNLSLAMKLQKRINAKYPSMMRPINLRTHRFNQQVSSGSLILEVGSDGNTMEEALNAAKIFAEELGEYLLQTKAFAK